MAAAAAVMTLPALADTETVDGVTWTYSVSNGVATVTRANPATGHLVIPPLLKGYPVTSIGEDAFYGCTNLVNVTIPDSVTSIRYEAFYGCSGLTNVTLPNSITYIEESAFAYDNGLASITVAIDNPAYMSKDGICFTKDEKTLLIYPAGKNGGFSVPSSVTNIGNYAFSGCSGLSSVTVPDSVMSIGRGAFDGCASLTSVVLPNSLTSIRDSVFRYCSGLTSVMIPKSVTRIGRWAFQGCSGLTNVMIPSSVTNIGTCAFSGCTELTRMVIPYSVSSIGSIVFYNCTNLKWLCVPENWEGTTMLDDQGVPSTCTVVYLNLGDVGDGMQTAIADGVLWVYSVDGGNASVIAANPSSGAVVIPSTLEGYPVTGISSNAFADCTNMTGVTIPASVEEIAETAFLSCSNLTTFTVATGNEYYAGEGGLLFSAAKDELIRCPPGKAGTVTLPANVLSIGNSAFRACKKVTAVNYGEGVMYIGEHAFSDCTRLSGMTIPPKVAGIEAYTFSGCTGLSAITIHDKVSDIKDHAFSGCSGLSAIAIPDKVVDIGAYSFSGCTGLRTATIGNGARRIGCAAFKDCSGLGSLAIPDSVETIADLAFSGCSGLGSMTLPEGVAYIGTNALTSCHELNVAGSWLGTDRLAVAGLPADAKVFYDGWCCSLGDGKVELTEASATNTQGNVTIPSSIGTYPVAGIGAGVFSDASGLTAVDIPAGMERIGESAFLNCTNLAAVGIHDLAGWCRISFGNAAANPLASAGKLFLDGGELTALSVPEGVEEIGAYAFYGFGGLATAEIPACVESIGHHAFYQCTNLAAVAIGNAATARMPAGEASTRIGDYAFYHCAGLETLAMGNHVADIGSQAFRACSALSEMTLPSGVTNVGNSAFYLCSALATLYVPSAWEGTQMLSAARVPSGGTIAYYTPEGKPETSSTPVAVPYSWLESDAAAILAAVGGDYEAAANANAANGRPVWECFLMGLDPVDAGAEFSPLFRIKADGTWEVAWSPDLNENGTKMERTYRVEGKREMTEQDWTDVSDVPDLDTAGWRFFRVGVALPAE